MGIDLLKDIYNPLAKKDEPQDAASTTDHEATTSCSHDPDHQQAASSWQDSATVMRLWLYMKERKGHGITIVKRGSIPALRFNPGLCRKDTNDRWKIAHDIERLFWDAFEDLVKMVRNGKLKLVDVKDNGW